MKLYLASASPRRRDLLAMLGLEVTICPADIDETMDPARDPAAETERLSREKAAAAQAPADAVVIAADTIVVCDGQVLGKPHDRADAERMLRLLSGRAHEVLTGLTVRHGPQVLSRTVRTTVHFRPIEERELAAYLATGESLDKAGAYGIQGRASIFCTGITGDYYNVMGLPLCELSRMLAQFDVHVLEGGTA